MPITFNTNLAALGAQRNIGIASANTSSSLAKLSSGSRVPQAKDDAAGLAIGSKLKSEVAGLTQASNNAGQAISLLQIADGALSTLGDILQRMKSLAVQSSSGQLDDASRSLLNQEFTNLQSEVDRVANVTNFNGTTLLAGSTTVTAKTNVLAAYSGTNATSATNLIGAGFESIDFSQGYGNGAIKIDYNATGRVLTVKDLVNNKTQSISLSATTLTGGATETYNFGDIGAKITINSQFNKATSIAGANVAAVNGVTTNIGITSPSVSLGLTGVTANTITIQSASLTGTGANEFNLSQLYGATSTFSGTNTTVGLSSITVGTHTFTNTTGVLSYAAAGNKDYTFNDGQGNSFVLRVATTGNATAGTAAGNLTINAAQPTVGAIESTGTGANAPVVTAVTESGVAANAFNFGSIDNARITINAAAAATTSATVTLNSVVFSTANAGGATANTSTTGIKTLTLADTNGNSFTVQFNVTNAFSNGDTAKLTLGQFGQIVGAASATTATTAFTFKVGTGTSGNDDIGFTLNSATTTALGISSNNIGTAAAANLAITAVNAAITSVASRRADVGAAQSRLTFASNNISVSIENTTAAQSSLLDVDVSAEITNFTNQNVLMQAGISLLGQANQQPALLLRLLQ